MRMLLPILLALSAAGPPSETPKPLPSIAVFDQQAAGGEGASVQGVVQGLTEAGYRVEVIRDLDPLSLAPHDILYLSDMHRPGTVDAGWRQHIESYVRAGGSVLQTWHHHLLPQVAYGVQRVYASRRMYVVPGHPAVAGLSDFQAIHRDHIVEKVGPAGTPLLKNEAGQVVAAAGMLEKGKVISTGLALAIPDGNQSAPPRGAEQDLLMAFLRWLKPTVPPAERIRALVREPILAVSPRAALVAAGTEAAFLVRVGVPRGEATTVRCGAARVTPAREPQQLEGGVVVHTYRVAFPTHATTGAVHEHPIQAQVGERTLEYTARVESVSATPPPNER
ncbi:MAG: hypothetical protein QHJ73_05515, partial [Armatimonadota bacterium]|nr:hypothetical protein [Armatimonadota bacterium]